MYVLSVSSKSIELLELVAFKFWSLAANLADYWLFIRSSILFLASKINLSKAICSLLCLSRNLGDLGL